MASSTISFSLFMALNCILLSVSAQHLKDGIEVPVASVPNANIPMTANEANTLSGEKEILPAMVPVNPAVPFKPDMPNTPIVNNPVELINKPEHSEQFIQNDDISNVDIKGEENLKTPDKIPRHKAADAADMNLVSVLNVLDDLKNKLDHFKEDIMQLALPIGMAAQMNVVKPEVEMSEVTPAEESKYVVVEGTPQQPGVSKNVNEPTREARSPYGGYGGGYGRPGYGGGYGRPGYGGGYGRPGYGGGYGRPGYGGGYGRPGYGGGYGRPGYGGGYGSN